LRAAIYARYSSENQRPESLEDQTSACLKLAKSRGYTVSQGHIYTDKAASGARKDRAGLAQIMAEAELGSFEVILVDDLSRLARDNYLMLSILAELRFKGVQVISVADGLDTENEDSTMAIQIRGIFNELQLHDLKKRTLRGQIGQKERGFSVGERTFGYKSVPVGTMRMDKKGRPRPEGYKMVVEPREASVVVRIFQEVADGISVTRIVRRLNTEGVPGCLRSSKGWSPSTVMRILRNEKYIGKWVWNKTETRQDPKTGRRRRFPKPLEQWIIQKDKSWQIVPSQLWEEVQKRNLEIQRTWPEGKRGFVGQRGSSVRQYPEHLLSGSMVCGSCGAAIAQVSGKSGGYYGCIGSVKGSCKNRLLVRRTLAERVILTALREKLASTKNIMYLFRQVERKVRQACSDIPETIKLQQSELQAEEARVANFVQFIGEGRGSKALADALLASEKQVETLRLDLSKLRHHKEMTVKAPPKAWLEERVGRIQSILEKRTQKSALLLRKLLGKIHLHPAKGEIGRPYYVAKSNLLVLALLEEDSNVSTEGSNSLSWVATTEKSW